MMKNSTIFLALWLLCLSITKVSASISATVIPPPNIFPVKDVIEAKTETSLATPLGLRLLHIPVSGGQFYVSWDSVEGAHYYLVHKFEADANPFDFVLAPAHAIKVLPSDQIELYQVQACTAENDCSPLSTSFSVDLRQEYAQQNPTQTLPVMIAPLQILATGNEQNCRFTLAWSESPNADGYKVYSRSTNKGDNPSDTLSNKEWTLEGTIEASGALFGVGRQKATQYAVKACAEGECSQLSVPVLVDLINDSESFQCSIRSVPICDPDDPFKPDCIPCRDAPNCDITEPPKDNDFIGPVVGTGTFF